MPCSTPVRYPTSTCRKPLASAAQSIEGMGGSDIERPIVNRAKIPDDLTLDLTVPAYLPGADIEGDNLALFAKHVEQPIGGQSVTQRKVGLPLPVLLMGLHIHGLYAIGSDQKDLV